MTKGDGMMIRAPAIEVFSRALGDVKDLHAASSTQAYVFANAAV